MEFSRVAYISRRNIKYIITHYTSAVQNGHILYSNVRNMVNILSISDYVSYLKKAGVIN